MLYGKDFAGIYEDISRHQIKHARQNVPKARLIVRDVLDISLHCKFDVVTCMFDSLNYLRTKKDLLKAFRKAKRHLAQGGLFAFDMNTFAGSMTATLYHELENVRHDCCICVKLRKP